MKILHRDTSANGAIIGSVVALLVAIIVGVLVWYKINQNIYDSIGLPSGALASTAQNATKAAYASVNTSANTILTLFPIIAIVLVAGVILAIVTNFGRGPSA